MGIRVVECVDWDAPNKPGELLKCAEHFKNEGVNLDALWAYTSKNNESKLAAIGKDAAKLKAALGKLGAKANSTSCFYLSGEDRAGVLVDALKALAGAGINVECADALAGDGKFGATIWVKDSDLAKARQALKA